jgi:hypothetical protein
MTLTASKNPPPTAIYTRHGLLLPLFILSGCLSADRQALLRSHGVVSGESGSSLGILQMK